MKLCMPHWDELKAAITARDLFRFVSSNGQIATEKMQAQLQPGASALEGFDPLLNANFAIWSNGLDAGGLYMMGKTPEGSDYCPLCELNAHGGSAALWIACAADEQLERARELGLVPKDLPA
jgi:hypothetical protein